MAFLPVAIGSVAWLATSYSYDLLQAAKRPVVETQKQTDDEEPFYGAMGHVRQYAFVDTRQIFRSVTEDTDAQGAVIFLVDYGNGAKITQYWDPRLIL